MSRSTTERPPPAARFALELEERGGDASGRRRVRAVTGRSMCSPLRDAACGSPSLCCLTATDTPSLGRQCLASYRQVGAEHPSKGLFQPGRLVNRRSVPYGTDQSVSTWCVDHRCTGKQRDARVDDGRSHATSVTSSPGPRDPPCGLGVRRLLRDLACHAICPTRRRSRCARTSRVHGGR
jgi:hypothetical protein